MGEAQTFFSDHMVYWIILSQFLGHHCKNSFHYAHHQPQYFLFIFHKLCIVRSHLRVELSHQLIILIKKSYLLIKLLPKLKNLLKDFIDLWKPSNPMFLFWLFKIFWHTLKNELHIADIVHCGQSISDHLIQRMVDPIYDLSFHRFRVMMVLKNLVKLFLFLNLEIL